MDGYEEFQRIMAEINRKKNQSMNVSDNDMLEKLKNMFGMN